MSETTSCARCGRELPTRSIKEVVYEEGRERIRQLVCPTCLNEIMRESSKVRGVVGTEKAAAIHVDRGKGPGVHQSFGSREQ